MTFFTDIDSIVEVQPDEQTQLFLGPDRKFVFLKLNPFQFRVQGEFREGRLVYGVFGPVLGCLSGYRIDSSSFKVLFHAPWIGPNSLVCSLTLRRYPYPDWSLISSDIANFKIGRSPAKKNESISKNELCGQDFFVHPDGLKVNGFPTLNRFCTAGVVS